MLCLLFQVLATGTSAAQSFTASVDYFLFNDVNGSVFPNNTWTYSNITGTTIQSGTPVFCFDTNTRNAMNYNNGPITVSNWTISNKLDDFMQHSTGANAQGAAYLNWVTDHYYNSWNAGVTAVEKLNAMDAYHMLLWEIAMDYDPTAGTSSLDLAAGDTSLEWTTATPESQGLASSMLSDMLAANVSSSYTSSQYTLQVAQFDSLIMDSDFDGRLTGDVYNGSAQPGFYVVAVPEPTGAVLLGATGVFALMRRRRRA